MVNNFSGIYCRKSKERPQKKFGKSIRRKKTGNMVAKDEKTFLKTKKRKVG